ncbi:unnamed protein product [Arabidopsis arenosa]|uniref:DUF1985 domain-containing protein n=1 Tax=Arabidopsis arenosa TaxID=38785 RepID=A0A8S1ZH71_ARAAE|nr:unnamed protein product [Arabidopsis arenosa]
MNQEPTRRGFVSGSAHFPAKNTAGEDVNPNHSLPCRLLAPDGLPDRVRLNIYSKTEYLGILVELLEGSEAWEDHQDPAYLSVWNRLFGEKRIVTVMDVIDMLRDDNNVEPHKWFTTWKKLSLALIVLVDGVVVCNNRKASRVTGTFVEMLHAIKFFMNYPWGRVSFEATMERFGPSLLEKDPIEELKTRLSQKSSCCYGPSVDLSRTILLRESDVVDAEYNPNVMEYTLYHSEPLKKDLSWPDEVVDPGVELIISLINQTHDFKPQIWHVHDIPCSPTVAEEKKATEPKKGPTAERQEGKGTAGAPLYSEGTKFVDLHSDDAEEQGTSEPRKAAKRSRNGSYHFPRKLFTRSAKIAEEFVGSSSSQFVTHSDLSDLKAWIYQQLGDLRSNINDDILKLVGDKSQQCKPGHPQTETSRSKAKKKKEKPGSRKRKRKDVTSLSFGSSSSGLKHGLSKDIPIGKDGGTCLNFEASNDTWDHYGAAKSISQKETGEEELFAGSPKQAPATPVTPSAQKIPAEIPTSPIPNSNAEDCNAEEHQKETIDEELFAGSPKQTPATPMMNVNIFHIVVKKLGDEDANHLAPLMLTNKRGRDIELSGDILHSANITPLCVDPVHIYPGGVTRTFFTRCLDVENVKVIYYESLCLITREGDIHGSLALLNQFVPTYEHATVAYAMFQMCAGRGDIAGATFDTIFENLGSRLWFDNYSPDLDDECEALIDTLLTFDPPGEDTFGPIWEFAYS